MFKVCDIKAAKLLGTYFPRETCEDFQIYGVSDPEAPENNTLIFVKGDLAEQYTEVRNSVFITKEDVKLDFDPSCVQLKSSMPKNLYGDLLKRMVKLMTPVDMRMVNGSYISTDARIGADVLIGPFCIIGRGVVIGDRCEIGAGTVIKDHVHIGNDVQIKEKCLIGVEDADIYRPESGECRTLPHLAGTVIEDGCLLLAGAVLAAGDTRTTVLGKGSMIGLLGDVGHNCQIGEGTLISGKASVSGHCHVGDHTYVAPMSVTTNRISVGDGAYLGIGAVAIKDVPDGEKQFGNPARKVLEMKKK
ncbi:MAG: hypothetical protein IKV59_02205 [Lachnospiraceae bacterium]|nr:hypothetical protein [Lachnospiraceae bacterium]